MNPISQLMLAAAFAAGLALSGVGLSAYDRFIDDPAVARAARDEGVLAERAIWEENRRKAEALNAQRLADAQAKINAADRRLADDRASDRRRADAIRRAYEERLSDDETAVPGCDCSRMLVPERVRKELE